MTRAQFALVLSLIALAFALLRPPCLPDTEDRFFMGRHQNACLYMDIDSGDVYEVKP